ncbi:MAG: SDR family oxidoreductase [Desulfofustis sp.]|nr:SDR family oxidoreductase [Desulfofustis sp.]
MLKTDELHGRVVLLPGACRPIGRAIAHSFARRGATLVVPIYPDWPQSNREMEEQFSQAGYDYLCLPSDLTSSEQTAALLAQVKDRYGVLHYLINNIDRGGMPIVHGPYDQEVNRQQWQLEFDTTLKTKHHLYHHSFDLLSDSQDGAVINISSIAAQVGRSGPASLLFSDGYSAANRGITSFTRQWARELAPAVRVNEVMLGLFEGRHGPGTRGWELMDKTQQQELIGQTLVGRTGTPDEAAEFIYYLAVSARYLTGAVIPFDGGYLLGACQARDMPEGILE